MSWSSDDAIDRARDELARQAGRLEPGWTFSHGLHGWKAKRESDGKTLEPSSLPGLSAMIAAQAPAGKGTAKPRPD